MRKVKTFRGWSIYEATKPDDIFTLENCKYGAYIPDESPSVMSSPEWCADSISELLDFIKCY